MRPAPFIIGLLLLTGCAWETHNRVFPKPVFVFSKEYIEYQNELRWERTHPATNSPAQ